MIELIIVIGIISAAIYLLILLYLLIGIMKTKTILTKKEPFVSVIIAAHNESNNIANCLDSILNQNYPHEKMEIIVVNDNSKDNTGLILSKYEQEHTYLHVITISQINKGISPKKYALAQGISAAKGEI